MLIACRPESTDTETGVPRGTTKTQPRQLTVSPDHLVAEATEECLLIELRNASTGGINLESAA